MEISRFVGWLILNVGVPLLAPIALLPLLGVGRMFKGRVHELIVRSLREGQLFWTVIAMCAAALYEAAVHLGELTGTPAEISLGRTIVWTAIAWHVAIIIISAVLVLLGTIDAADDDARAPSGTADEGVGKPPDIMVVSICMSIATAVSFTITHVWVS